ncbi:histidine kinase group protein, partial [Colletotrichum incanum]
GGGRNSQPKESRARCESDRQFLAVDIAHTERAASEWTVCYHELNINWTINPPPSPSLESVFVLRKLDDDLPAIPFARPLSHLDHYKFCANMAKKKNKQTTLEEFGEGVPIGSASQASANGSSKDSAYKKAASAIADTAPALIICRNKHWRFISSFHGPWLQMPIEILQTIANINYNTPRPRPIDPAVFFDLLKIRRLVDEATNLAVRAASDIASPTLTNMHGGLNGHMSSLGFGVGNGHGTKLSKERKFRMREQASQKLSRAYRLDEIACSVATMQGASPLEEIGSLVLQRSKDDPDAKYVHFFHEKIPSRQMAECTSLQPLNEVISARPTEGEALRTRATVRIFKDDYEGAAQDLSAALQVQRFHQPLHRTPSTQELQLVNGSRRTQDVILTEEQQPSSLETQLLFQRAGVYLTIACQHVVDGLPETPANGDTTRSNSTNGVSKSKNGLGAGEQAPEPTAADKESASRRLENRKLVKTYAKRALRDYMAYLSQFDYTPDLPLKVAKEFTEKVNLAANGIRHPRVPDTGSTPPYKTYALSDLFAAVPPTNIPPYPSQEVVRSAGPVQPGNYEAITYHPLLTDALHSLLLCHCLVQTSTKELLRHAYMVARLARLADGYPIFQASRSPARADWIEVLRRAQNWIQMAASWEQLCAPAPLPVLDGPLADQQSKTHPSPKAAALAAAAITRYTSTLPDAGENEEKRRERVRQQAIMDSLDDDRVVDEASLRAAITARQNRAEEDHEFLLRLKNSANGKPESVGNGQPSPALRRWSVDDGREYPILTERAAAIARWILEAPAVSLGTAKRKKKAGPKKDKDTTGAENAATSMVDLAISDPAWTVDAPA